MILSQKIFYAYLLSLGVGISFSVSSQPSTPKTTPSLQGASAPEALKISQKVMEAYQKVQVLQADFMQIIVGYGPQTAQTVRKSFGSISSRSVGKDSQIRFDYEKRTERDQKKLILVNNNKLIYYYFEDEQGCEKEASKHPEIEAVQHLFQGTAPLTQYFQVKEETPAVLPSYLGNKPKLIEGEAQFDKLEPGDQVLKLIPLPVEKNPYASYQNLLLVVNSSFLIKKAILLNAENVVNHFSFKNIKLNQDAKNITEATFQFTLPAGVIKTC